MNPRRLMLLAFVQALLLGACSQPQPHSPRPSASASPRQSPTPSFDQRADIGSISLEDLFVAQQSDQVLLFDARPQTFYLQGHIPGALSLPAENCDPSIPTFASRIQNALASGKTIVVYCTGFGCRDARTLARHLAKFGYPVSIFSSGWRAWRNAELPIQVSQTPTP